jgi:hypothetical protein
MQYLRFHTLFFPVPRPHSFLSFAILSFGATLQYSFSSYRSSSQCFLLEGDFLEHSRGWILTKIRGVAWLFTVAKEKDKMAWACDMETEVGKVE